MAVLVADALIAEAGVKRFKQGTASAHHLCNCDIGVNPCEHRKGDNIGKVPDYIQRWYNRAFQLNLQENRKNGHRAPISTKQISARIGANVARMQAAAVLAGTDIAQASSTAPAGAGCLSTEHGPVPAEHSHTHKRRLEVREQIRNGKLTLKRRCTHQLTTIEAGCFMDAMGMSTARKNATLPQMKEGIEHWFAQHTDVDCYVHSEHQHLRTSDWRPASG